MGSGNLGLGLWMLRERFESCIFGAYDLGFRI